MKPATVTQAAALLEQLDRLERFLAEAPQDGDTLTVTIRAGNRSRSLSLKDDAATVNMWRMVERMRDDTRAAVIELGVEL